MSLNDLSLFKEIMNGINASRGIKYLPCTPLTTVALGSMYIVYPTYRAAYIDRYMIEKINRQNNLVFLLLLIFSG